MGLISTAPLLRCVLSELMLGHDVRFEDGDALAQFGVLPQVTGFDLCAHDLHLAQERRKLQFHALVHDIQAPVYDFNFLSVVMAWAFSSAREGATSVSRICSSLRIVFAGISLPCWLMRASLQSHLLTTAID